MVFFKEKSECAYTFWASPSQEGKNVKTFSRWDQRLQIQNLFMAFKQVTLIAMQGHRKNSKNKTETM